MLVRCIVGCLDVPLVGRSVARPVGRLIGCLLGFKVCFLWLGGFIWESRKQGAFGLFGLEEAFLEGLGALWKARGGGPTARPWSLVRHAQLWSCLWAMHGSERVCLSHEPLAVPWSLSEWDRLTCSLLCQSWEPSCDRHLTNRVRRETTQARDN